MLLEIEPKRLSLLNLIIVIFQSSPSDSDLLGCTFQSMTFFAVDINLRPKFPPFLDHLKNFSDRAVSIFLFGCISLFFLIFRRIRLAHFFILEADDVFRENFILEEHMSGKGVGANVLEDSPFGILVEKLAILNMQSWIMRE